jgi:hypothetical protein
MKCGPSHITLDQIGRSTAGLRIQVSASTRADALRGGCGPRRGAFVVVLPLPLPVPTRARASRCSPQSYGRCAMQQEVAPPLPTCAARALRIGNSHAPSRLAAAGPLPHRPTRPHIRSVAQVRYSHTCGARGQGPQRFSLVASCQTDACTCGRCMPRVMMHGLSDGPRVSCARSAHPRSRAAAAAPSRVAAVPPTGAVRGTPPGL